MIGDVYDSKRKVNLGDEKKNKAMAEAMKSVSEENMQNFLSQNNMKIPYISDKDRTIAKSFGARRTPEAFVLQFDAGQAQIRYKGAIDDNAQSAGDVNHSFLNDAVRNLLSNKEVETKSTRANGCLIK